MPPDRGQASLEYVALIAIAALVMASAVALTSGGIGPRILFALQRGVCAVTATPCPAPHRFAADLPPCPLRRASHSEELEASVVFVRLAHDLGAQEVRYSDGHVDVTFTDARDAGLVGDLGVAVRLGGLEAGLDARAHVDLAFAAGRLWHFPDQAAADRFVHRYGSDQTIVGRAVNDLRRACFLCRVVGWQPHRPRPPDAVFHQAGARGHVDLLASDGASGAAASATVTAALGWREDRAGGRTLYLQLSHAGTAELFDVLSLRGSGQDSGIAQVTFDRRGRPTGVTLLGAGTLTAQAGAVAGPLAGYGGAGRMWEGQLDVDLRSPQAAALARRLASAAAPGHWGDLPGAVAAALAWARGHATATVRTYDVRNRSARGAAELQAGGEVGGALSADTQRLRLVATSTRLPGLPFMPRDDCAL